MGPARLGDRQRLGGGAADQHDIAGRDERLLEQARDIRVRLREQDGFASRNRGGQPGLRAILIRRGGGRKINRE